MSRDAARFVASLRDGATPGIDACIDALGDTLPLLHDFARTPQDPGWHAEGDVRVHTGMVLDALYEDLARSPVPDRVPLVLATLLHDIAKPLTTREQEIKGRVRVVAPKHEARGRSWLAPRLGGLGLSFAEQLEIIELVGAHHLPKGLVKDRPDGDWRRAARSANLARLARLELADMRGRTCDDYAANIEAIELFQLYAEELGVDGWEAAWRDALADFARLPDGRADRAFGEAIRGAESGRWHAPDGARWLAHVADKVPELVVLCGPSGSGKSTFVARHLSRDPWRHEVVSLDDLRESIAGDRIDQSANGQVRQAAREALRGHLRAGRRVVWDATNLRREVRQPLLQLGFDYGALVTLVVFLRDIPGWHRANAARPHAVRPAVLDAQIDAFEVPDRHEAHRMVVVGESGVVASFGTLDGRAPWGGERAA